MHMFVVGLLAATALASADRIEPSEHAMRVAFALDLADGVRAALAYVAETGGPDVLARIRQARTDEFEIKSFRKLACRPSADRPGHMCEFALEIDTVAGPIARTTAGFFYTGAWGLAYEQTTDG